MALGRWTYVCSGIVASLFLTGCPAPSDPQSTQDEPAFTLVPGTYSGRLDCEASLSAAGSASTTLFQQATKAEMTLTLGAEGDLTVANTKVEPGAVLHVTTTSITVDQTVTQVVVEDGRIRVRYDSAVALALDGEQRNLPGSGEYVITGREDGSIGFRETSRLTIESDASGFEALLECSGELSSAASTVAP